MAALDATDVQGMIASATPGRVRIRLHPSARANGEVHRVREHVAKQTGITHVAVNQTTGSVVVHYNQATTSLDDVLSLCADIGVIVGSAAGLEVGSEEEGATGTVTSRRLIDALDRLDRRLGQATGQKVDLRLLFPIALFGLGLRQVLVDGLGLTQIPGYVLLWYAFDAFFKLHQVYPLPSDPIGAPLTTGTASTGPSTPAGPGAPPDSGTNRG